MNRRALCIAVFAGLLSAGCANLAPHGPYHGHHRFGGSRSQQPPPPVECKANGPCKIPVDVVTVTGNGSTQATIIAPDAEIAKGNHGDGDGVAIQWHLTDSDYRFEMDSIRFYETRAGGQFSDPKVGGHGQEFHYKDKNTDVHGYGYQIKIYNRKTGDWLTLDPIIWNNN